MKDDLKKKTTNAAKKSEMQETSFVLPELDIQVVEIPIEGTSELICHNWSVKIKREMLQKQMGKAQQKKAPKDPDEEFRGSLYPFDGQPIEVVPHPGGYGFPAIAFKNAAVTACTSLGKAVMTKVAARQSFHILGELVKLDAPEPRMREDMVRVGMGVADLRFRGGFVTWGAVTRWSINRRVISPEQLTNLVNIAGFAVGVAEWRPEKGGPFGRFRVKAQS